MKLLFDFFPVLLFFISYKIYGIYIATAVAIAASFVQVIFYRIKHQKYERMHLISLALISILGGATLIAHDPDFIKYKPTAIYWLSSLIFLGTTWIGKKPLIQRMMESNISLPVVVWLKLNVAWSIFFAFMGVLNLYVAWYYSTDTWVNFKLFGGIGLTLLFVIIQAVFLAKHIDEQPNSNQSGEELP